MGLIAKGGELLRVLSSSETLGGRYELDQRIGAGSYSEVWRAADLVLAREVAVKLLYAGLADDAATLTRFRAEGRHAGRLQHENIARVYDYGEPDGTHPPFLVIELIDGPSLAGLLRDGPPGHARTARIIAQTPAAAARQLRQLGLTVHVVWETSGGQAAGTVLDVRPAGRRPVGSLVTLVGAFRRAGHRDPAGRGTPPGQDPGPGPGHGAGNGNGNGQGNGNGNGPGHGKSDGTGPDNGNSHTLADS